MLRILLLITLITAAYFGYQSYQSKQLPPATSLPKINISHSSDLGNIADVLGASIVNFADSGRSFLSTVTDGASDPIINTALTNIQNEVKDLPKEAVDKVKYEFCKDVVIEYENR